MTELNASFSLFPVREKKSDRSPDHSGVIEIPVDQIDALVAHLGTIPESNWKDEAVVRLRVAAWNGQSRNGKSYLNGKVSVPMQQQQAPAASDEEVPF